MKSNTSSSQNVVVILKCSTILLIVIFYAARYTFHELLRVYFLQKREESAEIKNKFSDNFDAETMDTIKEVKEVTMSTQKKLREMEVCEVVATYFWVFQVVS